MSLMQVGASPVEPLIEIREKSKRLVEAAASIGAIVSLMMRSTDHADIAMRDLERFLMPAILNRQCLIVRAPSQQERTPLPAAAVLWAELSPELYAQCFKTPGKHHFFSVEQRKSGDNIWVTDVMGEPLIWNKALDRLHKTVFAGKRIGLARKSLDGVWSSIEHPARG